MVSNCAAPASSTASRVRKRVVRLDDRDVEGASVSTGGVDRGVRLHGGYLPLAAALAAPVVGAGVSGGRSTR